MNSIGWGDFKRDLQGMWKDVRKGASPKREWFLFARRLLANLAVVYEDTDGYEYAVYQRNWAEEVRDQVQELIMDMERVQTQEVDDDD